MAAKTAAATTEALKELTYFASALKAPGIIDSAARLVDHARDAGWSHEEYVAAVLDREVVAPNASGQLRIKAAGFAARQTIEEFDWAPTRRSAADRLTCILHRVASWPKQGTSCFSARSAGPI